MGGSASKTAINSLSEQITNIAMSTVQSCEASVNQSQELNVTNTGFKLWGNYKLEQKTDIRSECFSDVNKQADLQNKIIQAISQATTADNVALLGAFGRSDAEARANLSNVIRTNVTMSNIQRSYNDIKQTQKANFSNSGIVLFEQLELTQGSKIFAAATLSEIDRAGIFNTIETAIDQSAKSTMQNPLDFIAKAIGSVASSVTMTVVFFIVIVMVIIFGAVVALRLLFSSGKPDASAVGAANVPASSDLTGAGEVW